MSLQQYSKECQHPTAKPLSRPSYTFHPSRPSRVSNDPIIIRSSHAVVVFVASKKLAGLLGCPPSISREYTAVDRQRTQGVLDLPLLLLHVSGKCTAVVATPLRLSGSAQQFCKSRFYSTEIYEVHRNRNRHCSRPHIPLSRNPASGNPQY